MNGYVRAGWPMVAYMSGRRLLTAWYDRPYEYAWTAAHLDRIATEVGRPLRILDVGPGAYQPWIDELVDRGHVVDAIDLDPEAVKAVRGRLGAVAITQRDGKTMDVTPYDLVTCVSVVEHDPAWRPFVANLLRARRLLLTFGVIRDGHRWPAMYIGEKDVGEILAAVLDGASGGRIVDWLDAEMPADAVAGLGGAGLTFVLATERP